MDGGQPPAGSGDEVRPAPQDAAAGSRSFHRPALLARLPRPFWHPPVEGSWGDADWPVVAPGQVRDYPLLGDDLQVWCEHLEPRFRKLDHQAAISQNQFWLQNLALILGGLLATSLAAVQVAMGGGIVALAVTQATLTGLLAGLAVLIRSGRAQRGYLSARLKAERIKSEYYLFLGRAGDYAEDSRVTRLLRQVDDIESAEAAS